MTTPRRFTPEQLRAIELAAHRERAQTLGRLARNALAAVTNLLAQLSQTKRRQPSP